MARQKPVDVVNETKPTQEESSSKAVDWQAVAILNETKAYDAIDNLNKMEEFLAALMPDLRLAARYFTGAQVAAGPRFETAYQKVREMLGAKGQSIDAGIRGQ